MKLTEYQIEIIKDLFFPQNIRSSHKLNSIINKLLREGVCLSDEGGGNVLTTMGGVGNFIYSSRKENGVGVVNLTMNREDFFNSVFFQELLQNYHNKKAKEVEKVKKEAEELSFLIK